MSEVSREEKRFLLQTFEKEFHVSAHEASSLLSQVSYLLRDATDISDELENILDRSRSSFTDEQIESTIRLMQKTASLSGPAGERKQTLIKKTTQVVRPSRAHTGKWRQQKQA